MKNPKRIAIIGANGQLGSDLITLFAQEKDVTLLPLTHQDIEITEPDSIQKAFANNEPDIIVNAAAYNKVDAAEEFSSEAFLVNGVGNKNLAKYCGEHEKIFISVSTDYVFGVDKDRKTPYKETDTPGPINAYGISKLAGELFVQYASPKHFIVRTCGLFGLSSSSGKGYNFVELMLRLAREKGHVQVVNDQIMTPTYTVDLAKQIIVLLQTNTFGLYHATAEGACSWYDFAKEIFARTNTQVNLEPVPTAHFPTTAKRGNYSVLENHKLKELGINIMRDWKIGLEDYLKERGK